MAFSRHSLRQLASTYANCQGNMMRVFVVVAIFKQQQQQHVVKKNRGAARLHERQNAVYRGLQQDQVLHDAAGTTTFPVYFMHSQDVKRSVDSRPYCPTTDGRYTRTHQRRQAQTQTHTRANLIAFLVCQPPQTSGFSPFSVTQAV